MPAKKRAAKRPAKKRAAKKRARKPKPRSAEFEAAKWKPGQSGNPAGRPKKKTFEEVVRGLLDEQVTGADHDKLEALGRVVISEALIHRNNKQIGALIDRLWPAPKELKVSGDPEKPIGALDYSKLSVAQLKVLRDILKVARVSD